MLLYNPHFSTTSEPLKDCHTLKHSLTLVQYLYFLFRPLLQCIGPTFAICFTIFWVVGHIFALSYSHVVNANCFACPPDCGELDSVEVTYSLLQGPCFIWWWWQPPKVRIHILYFLHFQMWLIEMNNYFLYLTVLKLSKKQFNTVLSDCLVLHWLNYHIH